MKSFTIAGARYDDQKQMFYVAKEIVNDDDSVEYNLQQFHAETLEWYMAVYDIEDVDEVIDLILHIPFIEEHNPLRTTRAAAKAFVLSKVVESKASRGGNSVSKQAAGAMKARMAAKGIPQDFVDAADVDVYTLVRDLSPVHRDTLKLKREHIEKQREVILNTQRPVEPVDHSSRVTQLRKQLAGPKGPSQKVVPKALEPKQNHVKVTLRKGQKPERV